MTQNRTIVVVGGGYAGLAFVNQLRHYDRSTPVTLIDRNPCHTLLVESHQVAAGSRSPESILIPFDRISGVRFLQAEVLGGDLEAGILHTTAGPVPFDHLVLAVGSVDDDFGVPGVREHCQVLRGFRDAVAIRNRLAALPPGAPVVVAGGGLTGVELAAQIALRRTDGGTVMLVEAAPALLPGLPAQLGRFARQRLGQLGVNVITGAPVVRVESGLAHLRDGTALPFGLMVWACGVRAHPLVAALGLPTDRSGRALVGRDFQTPLPGVYAIGDCAAGHAPSAQLALQQGRALAAALSGRTPARPREKGVLVDLGQGRAVGQVGPLTLRGLLPGWLKRWTEVAWVAGVLGWKATLHRLVHAGAVDGVRPPV